MKIGIIGYGKMGHMVEQAAMERGHKVVWIVNEENKEALNDTSAAQADVAIEFTGPEAAFQNVCRCFDLHLPVVSGSTGWNNSLESATAICKAKNGTFLHSSNFSVGVNLFFQLNKHLARMMDKRTQYDVTIRETHHIHKKDAPSGTAITLAEQIIDEIERKKYWSDKPATERHLLIESIREGEIPGIHEVKYSSAIDDLEIRHSAHNRKGFAVGAVLAAEYIANKKGVFTMEQVLGFD